MTEQGWIFSAGIIVAVIAYYSKNFILEPLLEFRKIKGRIQNSLKFNANKIFNHIKNDEARELSIELRRLSCDLEEGYYAITFRKALIFLKILPPNETLVEISGALMFISNSLNDIECNGEKHKFYDTIKKKLKIL